MIQQDTVLYDAIEDAIYKIFEGKIDFEDPKDVTTDVIKSINEYLENNEEDEEE